MYPVVYSYKRSKTREFELSLESLNNIKEWNGVVFVIGEVPDVGNHVKYNHIPIKYKWGKESHSKSNDEICAYLTAADFLDEFIIMADDIYILQPWSLEYQNRGTLDDHIKTRARGDSYARQLRDTRDFLLDNGQPTLSYEMHIPMLVKSDQLRDAAELVRTSRTMFIRSIIGNWFEIPSNKSIDPKNQPLTDDTVLYSSQDSTFDYEKVRSYLK